MEASTKNTVPLILFAFLFVIVQSFPVDDVDVLEDKCLAENNITKEEYEILLDQTSLDTDSDNWDRKYKCYFDCLAKEMDILNNSGYVDVDKVYALELSADYREAFFKCKELHDEPITDPCEYALNIFICLGENIDQFSKEESK